MIPFFLLRSSTNEDQSAELATSNETENSQLSAKHLEKHRYNQINQEKFGNLSRSPTIIHQHFFRPPSQISSITNLPFPNCAFRTRKQYCLWRFDASNQNTYPEIPKPASQWEIREATCLCLATKILEGKVPEVVSNASDNQKWYVSMLAWL